MNALIALSQLAPVGSLEAYIQYVNQIPILTAEQEYHYAKKLQQYDDKESAKQLILSHLRYVVRVAKGYAGYGLPLADLIQEGNIGLMKAVKRFDPELGVRLVSFAVHWIKSEIHEYVIKNWRLVKIATTKAQRKLFFNLRQMKKRLGWFSKEEIQTVAEDLGVTPADVMLMEQRLNASDIAFEGGDQDETTEPAPCNYIADNRYDPAQLVEQQRMGQDKREHLLNALDSLDERSRDIINKRWLQEPKATLQDLAAQYNVSAERVRQLEQNAINKVKNLVVSALQ